MSCSISNLHSQIEPHSCAEAKALFTELSKRFVNRYLVHSILCSPDVLYFNTIDKRGIETLLVDEDDIIDIERDRESLMHFVKFLYEDNQAHFCKITWSFS